MIAAAGPHMEQPTQVRRQGRENSLLAELHLLSRDALHVLFDASSQEGSVVGCLLVRLAPVFGEGVHHSTISLEAWHVCAQCRVQRFNVEAR